MLVQMEACFYAAGAWPPISGNRAPARNETLPLVKLLQATTPPPPPGHIFLFVVHFLVSLFFGLPILLTLSLVVTHRYWVFSLTFLSRRSCVFCLGTITIQKASLRAC